jgi:hypothetical protein
VSVAMTLFASVSMIGDGQSRRKVFFVAVILIVYRLFPKARPYVQVLISLYVTLERVDRQ